MKLFDESNWERADFEVVLPAAIDEATKSFRRETKKLPKTFAMVHSKVVVIDPFGAHPVVITGSHNLGPKASGTNDENLLVIRDAPGLAAAYVSNIMAVYNQYRWRFRRAVQPVDKRWKGLKDSDSWQTGYLKKGSRAARPGRESQSEIQHPPAPPAAVDEGEGVGTVGEAAVFITGD